MSKPSRDEQAEAASGAEGTAADLEALREQVEEQYDFENFGPAQMAEMSAAEWEAVFDLDSWITGSELLERIEADLKAGIVARDVFARVERLDSPDRLVAYSDEGYAVVYPDGTTEGQGTVRRDVEPLVALNSMEEYDPAPMPRGEVLPAPIEVPEGTGETGNRLVQFIAGVQLLAAAVLLGAWLLSLFGVGSLASAGPVVLVAGLGFLVIGLLLFLTVANARLSDRFRAEEYRNRLRAVGVDSDERPEWLPPEVEWPVAELPDEAVEENPAASPASEE